MTAEEFKRKLREHNFSSCLDFINFVEEYQKMPAVDKYSISKEEYEAVESSN